MKQWAKPTSNLMADESEGYVPRLTAETAHFPPALMEKAADRLNSKPLSPPEMLTADAPEASLLIALADIALANKEDQIGTALISRVWERKTVSPTKSQHRYSGQRFVQALEKLGRLQDAEQQYQRLIRDRSRGDLPELFFIARQAPSVEVSPPG